MLHVDADLRFSVSAPSGRTATGSVSSDGDTLRVRTNRPATLIRSLGSNDRTRTAAVVRRLSAAGITVDVSGPHGEVARFGAGVDSRLGQLLAGSRNVDVRGLAVTTWRTNGRRVAVAASGAAVLAVLVSRLARRRG